jgi:hypothetical protein
MPVAVRLLCFCSVLSCLSVAAHADVWRVAVETGATWQTRNDVRIPGVGGTRFDVADVTGGGPYLFGRVELDWNLAGPHELRIVHAPLRVQQWGELTEAVEFAGSTFGAGAVRGTYQFNAPRVTYRYRVLDSAPWDLRIGATALVRDAIVRLAQTGESASDSDVGLVPLLHVYGAYRWAERWYVALEADALAAPQGRAIDLSLRVAYEVAQGWDVHVGYRALEGGADNDSVFNFAWFNFATIGIARRF